MAPEVHAVKDDCLYTRPADVYSFGMTCYEIIFGKYHILSREYTVAGIWQIEFVQESDRCVQKVVQCFGKSVQKSAGTKIQNNDRPSNQFGRKYGAVVTN